MIVSKKQKDPKHMFDQGYIWNDATDGIASKDFMSFEAHNSSVDWLSYCKERGYGPDRTIIALAPTGNTIVESVKSTVETIVSSDGYIVKTYASRDEIISIISKSTYEKDGNPGICMGAALEVSDPTNNQYQLNMIFDDITIEASSDSNMPNQRFGATDKYLREPFLDAWNQYKEGGYTYLQNLFANHILKERTNTNSYISMAYVPVKSSKYNKDDFAYIVAEMWSFFVLFVFLGNLYRLVYNTVNEKETKVREAMKIMGLTDTPYWLSWFAYSLVINTFICLVMILICIPIFEYSDLSIIFCYFWFFGLTMFGFAVFIGAFFSSGKTAAIVASMLFFLTSFLQIAVERRTVSETRKVLASFFPAVNVQLAGTILFEFEASGSGLTYDNIDELYKNYRFSYTIYMNIINFIVLTLLGLYLEKVLPGATGVRRPLWFPFTRQFW